MLMKKFLLSAAMILSMAFSANAETTLDLAKSSLWNGGSRDGNVVTFNVAWDGLAWWIGNQTGIVKIVAEFEEATPMVTQFLVQFNDIKDASNQAPAGSTKLEIDLPEGDIKQLAIQNAEPGVIKVKSVTMYTADDLAAPTPGADKKELVLTLKEAKANAWDNQVVINFPKPLEAGKKYTITMDVKGSVALEPKEGQYGKEAIQPVAQDANSDNKDQWGGPADLQYLNHFTATTEWVKGVKDCDGNAIVTDGIFPYSRLMLNLGNYAGELSIDNLRAIDEAGEEYFCITFDTPEEQKLVEDCWMKVPKTFKVSEQTSSINSVATESEEAAYDLFGNAGATKGFMVKGGKKVYVK